MSAPLTDQELQSYTSIIDGILQTADLETLTRRKILQALETCLGGKSLNAQKDAVKKLIKARVDIVSDIHEPNPSTSPEPARKKIKRSSSTEDADARLAAELQAQENSLGRSRTTRGGSGDKGKVPKKNKTRAKAAPRKKSSKKVSSKDDSDVEADANGDPPKRKAGGGFQKPFMLSSTLSELCGETTLSRPQVVKKLWEHIKANDLQDPADRRQILCDVKMQAVFKQAKVDMFRMNKDIGSHLYPVEDSV
ncbi:hypothetical protein G7046_g2736 [Stylonectria norvegica]|nr:hypothetical protein G7046_g2736 [Stylonectria norvegica]